MVAEAQANSINTDVNCAPINAEAQVNGGSFAEPDGDSLPALTFPEDGRTTVLLRACQAMSTLQVAIGVVCDTRVDLDDSDGCPANFWPLKVKLMEIEEELRKVKSNVGRLYHKALTEPVHHCKVALLSE